ncbi:two component LuxR family transcriptional regulator [Gloeomargarita lithophora Alchichica-D10]|uniref:Two component LuxR family transcriptional regulator n=1 Tax=Gloeomargarita lithophora Alchichica-D10 TaxID=1188229 RepID=A0A1J0AFI7_9CYAN|nr:response regulator transcription factor [Gloeomargarita lithophora]APB34705.1 two component LuxR family transcriptional regulator [Gloeomargarita lithophora Alchichica-D10]
MTHHILLVDDEPGLRQAVQAYLEESGFTVTAVANAQVAWEFLQNQKPDLVVSDVMMPQVSGYEFLKQLRDDARFQHLPVVFLTARGMTKDRISGFRSGVDGYIAKPFDPEELVAVIGNLLRKNEPQPTDMAQELAEIKALLARQGGTITKEPLDLDLTPRERSVLELLAQGLMNKEIAHRLETSVRNVEKYVSRLFSKTGTNSRTELVRFALENGLAK